MPDILKLPVVPEIVRKGCMVLLIVFLSLKAASQNIDIEILRFINSPNELLMDPFFRCISNSEAYLVIGIPVGLGATALIKDDDEMFRTACATIAATAVSFGVTSLLKYTIDRERPFVTYPDIKKKSDAGSPSFPSGHTSSAFSTATSLSLAWPKWYIIAPSFTWASLVGYSRMHLGVHYPSDVLAGALIGAGSAWLTHEINDRLNQKHRRKACNCPSF